MSSAAEYWAHRHGKNVCVIERGNSKFWVMRSQASDTETAAAAVVQHATAKHLVDLLHMSEAEAVKALENAKIIEKQEGAGHISIWELNLLFEAHCVVVEGARPAQYCPKIHGRPTSKGRRLCTCGLFVQRAECPHVYFVAGSNDELDLNNLPEKRKPGRPKADAAGRKSCKHSQPQLSVRERSKAVAAQKVMSSLVASLAVCRTSGSKDASTGAHSPDGTAAKSHLYIRFSQPGVPREASVERGNRIESMAAAAPDVRLEPVPVEASV